MDERKLKLVFDSDFKNVDIARAAIGGICRELTGRSASESIVLDFSLAVTEAMNNAVEHSGARAIEIEIILTKKEILFRMFTEGEKYEPLTTASMPILEDNNLAEGGFGLAIIQELVDKVDYEYRDSKNVLTLKKNLSADAKE